VSSSPNASRPVRSTRGTTSPGLTWNRSCIARTAPARCTLAGRSRTSDRISWRLP